jgi:hypothetical protein
MSRIGALRRVALSLATALELSGCGWTELEAVAQGAPDARASDAKAMDARAHPQDATDAPVEQSDAANEDALPDIDASAPCIHDGAPIYAWTFDSSVESWALSLDTGVKATSAWTGSTGYPTLGAVDIQITPQPNDAGDTNGGWIQYAQAFGDLSGRTVSAWVWLESGKSPDLQFFAKTGSQYVWGDNGTVHLHPQTWTCISLPISAPYYTQPGYDPTDVVTIGFLFLGTDSFTVYVDTVTID